MLSSVHNNNNDQTFLTWAADCLEKNSILIFSKIHSYPVHVDQPSPTDTMKDKVIKELKVIGQHALKGAVAGFTVMAIVTTASVVVCAALSILGYGVVGFYSLSTAAMIKELVTFVALRTLAGTVTGGLAAALASAIGLQAGISLKERNDVCVISGIFGAGLGSGIVFNIIEPGFPLVSALGYSCLPVFAIAAVMSALVAIENKAVRANA